MSRQRAAKQNKTAMVTPDMHPAERYARMAVAGLLVCGELEIKACQRHLDDLKRQGTTDFPYIFDETRAQRIYDWFERCCYHPRGVFSGQRIKLNSSQKFDLGCVFGWVHKDTGRRRFKKAYDEEARGNAKSVKLSGVGLYGICSDCVYPPGRPEQRVYELSPEVDCVAVDRQQAKVVWEDAATMGKKSPDISKRLKFLGNVIKHKTRAGMMRPFSKDTKNKEGAAPCIYILDEYHVHPTSEFYDTGQSAFGKRPQCLMYIITTAGKNAENSPCKKEHDICEKILNREIIQEDYFCMIRCLDKNDDPHDFKNLPKANPMLHEPTEYSDILLEEIISEHNIAYGSGDPAKIREWLIKRCCLWQEGSTTKFMDGLMDVWKKRGVGRKKFEELVRGLPCLVGDDMSKRIDLTGQAQVWKLPDGHYALRARGFIPESGVKRHEHTDRVEYRHWAKGGHVIITAGDVIDYEYLIEDIRQQETDLGISVLEFDIDQALATSFGNALIKQEYEVAEIRQNITTLSEPTKLFREMTIKGELIHENNPCLDWCLRNAEQYTDPNENIRLSKKNKDDSQRIDLVAAAINTIVRLKVLDEGKVEDVSEFAEADFLNKLWN